MKVLLTGAEGYIGVRMGAVLMAAGHDVVGLDSGFHRVGWLYNSTDPRPPMLTMDTRMVTEADLAGFDAVVHLAEVSNDPVGELNQDVTYKINHHGSVRLAEVAKRAGVSRFVHMSSCSVYGATGEFASCEGDATEPLTSYAKSKVLVEEGVSAIASDAFSPTFLRNATAFGASARQRFDLVVNDLSASAFLYKEIRMASDGTPWRPFVHILDIAKAVACVLAAPQQAIHNEIFNVGSDNQNYQVRQIAEIIGDLVPGCSLTFGDSSADKRNYRVNFDKIHTQLPGFSCDWDVRSGAAELLGIMQAIGFSQTT
jgi:nucleoside-diphosphate-sugar epimerase